jgi:hypothetical protein
MSPATLRTIIVVILFIHAVGHFQGILVGLGVVSTEKWNIHSWLLDGPLGEKGSRILGLILWAVLFLGFLALAFAFLGIGLPHSLWRPLAVPLAVVGLLTLIAYWNSFVLFFPNKIGALAVDLALIASLLFLNWPGEAAIGF